MQTINFAKRAKRLVPNLTEFKIEQRFRLNDQGYFISDIHMWIHTNHSCSLGKGGTKVEAWEELAKDVNRLEEAHNAKE